MVRFDVAKPGGSAGFQLVRDWPGPGSSIPPRPSADSTTVLTDGGNGDLDPAPGQVAFAFHVGLRPARRPVSPARPGPLGPEHPGPALGDRSRTPAPGDLRPGDGGGRQSCRQPAPGRDHLGLPRLQTPVASAHIQPDGAYTLPVPPGTYLVFAEWFGNLRSQRQIVTVAPGQRVANLDLPLLHGQEVGGTVKAEKGQPQPNAPVQAISAGGRRLPPRVSPTAPSSRPAHGQYTVTARGGSRSVTVAGSAAGRGGFPAARARTGPAVGTIVTVAGNGSRLRRGWRPRHHRAAAQPRGRRARQGGQPLHRRTTVANRIRKVEAGGQGISHRGRGMVLRRHPGPRT